MQDLPFDLQREAMEKIKLFKENSRNPLLRMHKLKGRLKDRWSFSVNYRFRIVFRYDKPGVAALLAVGDHEVYKA